MSKRPTSMAMIRQQLQRLLAQQTANQPSPLQQSLPPMVKRRGFVGCLAIGFVGLATVGSSTAITGYVLKYLASTTHLPPPDTTGQPATVTPTSGVANSLSLTVPLYTYRGHEGTVTALSWSPNGHWIASADVIDQTVSWSPNGNYIASGGQDRTVQVWDAQKAIHAGLVDKTVSPVSQSSLLTIIYGGHSGAINNLAWSPDGQYIASAAEDVTVQVWHSGSGRRIFTYKEHTKGGADNSFHGVTSVSWSPNGRYIASGAYDGTVKLWNAR